MKRTWFMIAAGFVAGLSLVLAGVIFATWPDPYRGSMIDPALPASDFTLTTQDGEAFQLSDQQGKVVLVFFGYTSCPDVCPATLAEFKRVRAEIGKEADDVRFLFVTVDPQRDTPDRIGAYIQKFDENIIGLSGEEETLSQVWQNYGVFVEKDGGVNETAYLVSHSSRIYALDRAGNLRLTFPFGTSVEDITHDVRLLLKEKVQTQ